jgi:multidrug efflux pump subunit AcrA (membrane-fusion protein)
MRRFICQLSCCLLALALVAGRPAFAAAASDKDSKSAEESKGDEKPKADEKAKGDEKAKAVAEAKKPPASKPATHAVKKEPLKIEATLSGVFEAQKMTEISLKTEAWTMLSVVSAVEHGTRVNRGDLLVSLDREKIDRAIADLRKQHQASDLAMKLAEQQLLTLEKTTPMDFAAGERAHKEVQEDLEYYFDVRRPMALKSAEFSLKYSQESYEFQKEELRQLEKMYAADDLTEETEEIILRRARNALAREKFYLEQSKIRHDRTVNVLISRDDVAIRESAKRLDLLWKDSKLAIPTALKKARLDMEKLKETRARSEERLKKLLADRAAMTVKAPTAGVVYYGKCVRGRFSSSSSGSSSLRKGSSLPPKQVFMTIVKTRPMFIRTSVSEKQLHQIRAGIKGTAVPTGFPDMKLSAIAERVATVPTGSLSFDSRITVAVDRKVEALMPGMTCKVTLVSYENKQALTIPPNYLKTDEADQQKHYVYLLGKKDKAKKQYVTVGKRTATKVEILKGLSEGDKVLPKAPKEEKPSEEKKPPKKEKGPSKKKKKSVKKDEDAAKKKEKDSPKKDEDATEEKA